MVIAPVVGIALKKDRYTSAIAREAARLPLVPTCMICYNHTALIYSFGLNTVYGSTVYCVLYGMHPCTVYLLFYREHMTYVSSIDRTTLLVLLTDYCTVYTAIYSVTHALSDPLTILISVFIGIAHIHAPWIL